VSRSGEDQQPPFSISLVTKIPDRVSTIVSTETTLSSQHPNPNNQHSDELDGDQVQKNVLISLFIP
jgi:hypothetical protein